MTLRTTLALAGALVAASFAMPAFADQHGTTAGHTQKAGTPTATGTADKTSTTGNGIGTQKPASASTTDKPSTDEKSKTDHATPDHGDDHTGQGETKATKVPASPH